MKTHNNPNVLLIVTSYAPPMTQGAPQNLYNLFSQFPSNSYCILTSYGTIRRAKPSGTWLAGDYFFYDYSGNAQKSFPPPVTGRNTSVLAGTYGSLAEAAKRLPPICRKLFVATVQGAYLLRNVIMTLRTAPPIITGRKIECILGTSDIGSSLISTYLLSRHTGVPYVLYLFDIYVGNRLPLINDLLARIFEPLLFRNASLVIVTNEGAEQFYRKKYGDAFRCAVVHNSVFPSAYTAKRTLYAPRKPSTVVYTGQVYWAQERSLMNLFQALDESELPVQVDVYVPNASKAFKESIAKFPNVRLSSAPPSEMPNVQSQATILYLPLSWHTGRPEVIATATPGKLGLLGLRATNISARSTLRIP